jgi:Domain of unknown function (DUF4091)
MKHAPITLSRKILLLLLVLFFDRHSFGQIKYVWALGDGEKIFRDDHNPRGRNGNFTWDGKTIHLKGLYNEILAFQVIAETADSAATGIELSVGALVNNSSGDVIGGSTLLYGTSGTIEVFTEHYLLVKDSTPPNWYYGSPAAAPEKMKGWIPDALIPTDATPGLGGFPVDISANQNQGFWIDVHLPRDQKICIAGVYKTKVQLWQRGKIIKEIPLEVTLLPRYLPDENVTNVWVYTGDVYKYFPTLSQPQVDKMLKFEGHRHRIDVVGGFDVNQISFNRDSMDKYKPWLNGEAYTPANGYRGPGEGVGEKLFPVGMYAAPVMGTTKDAVQLQSDLWVEWFRKNAPKTTYFWYIIDEPDSTKYAWIKERSGWIKSNPGIGKYMPVYTTTAYKKELSGAIDIWAGYDGVDLSTLPAARKNGGDHWFYNGNRPRYGSVILEATAVDLRVNSWVMYKYGINTWFVWNGTHWQHNGQGPKRHLHQNMFANPLTFINDNMEYGNGDGILFYPGHMPFYPEEDRGLNRIIPSIRLKNIRRGQQDALIMEMAAKKAGRDKVIKLVNSVVPKALSEVSMKAAVPWSQRGDDYDRVRDELLQLL